MKTIANMEDLAAAVSSLAPVMTGVAQGSAISLSDSADRPLNALTLCGKSTQATITGAQLLDISGATDKTNAGMTLSFKGDGSYVITGTATAEAGNLWLLGKFYDEAANPPILFTLPAGTYTVNGAVLFSYTKAFGGTVIGNAATFTLTDDTPITGVRNPSLKVGATYNDRIYPMLNAGSTLLPWEPYTGGNAAPNPDYPQNIDSIGSSGSIAATVCGKNIMPFPYTTKSCTANGITFTVNDDKSITVTGTNTENHNCVFSLYNGFFAKGITYTFKCYGLPNDCKINVWYYGGPYGEGIRTFTIYDTSREYRINIEIPAGVTIDAVLRPILVFGKTIDSYVPQSDAQTITLPLPGGLHGIPVPSGGNYTDENGQQWVCDTVELRSDGTGKRVQRIGMVDNTKWGLTNIAAGTTGTRFVATPSGAQAIIAVQNTPVICTHYKQGKSSFTVAGNFISTGETHSGSKIHIRTTHENMTAEEFRAWATDVGMETYYILAAPIETDITAEEIAAFKALHTNCPATTIYNDSSAGQTVEYVIDTKTYIDNKFAELQNAVLSTGGNV